MDAHKRPRNRGNESKLARLRQEAGLTQQQLADSVGATFRTVQRWENGALPTGRYLVPIARALGCKIDDLFEDKKDG